ncbi:hypothetical protein PTTG_28319 [Puccinia triticina 1-1 BBBD Race 1]|uniref:CCHC-type domain-containing protein n=1 Tax=Puccinia triticina (isolate 1-1 / race 1 (BBBD)) TaxID=630390 RepID=A0A180GCT1_PUCT1|nr:hypothetical protein PTTG_28319 [Puccinia triticina 1-1 BBBD Race 1]
MSHYRMVHNVSSVLALIATLDGTEAVFPCWRDRLEGVLGMQNTLDIVKGSLTRYNPKEIAADWDALSDLACHTIRLTLSDPLSQRYRKVKPAPRLYSTIVNAYEKNTRARRMRLHEAFWNARHDPNEPIALWIGHVRVAADDLLTVKELPTDRQIADRLVGGLDSSWSNVRDAIVYTANEMSLDDVIGAMEAHEVSLNGNKTNDLASVSAAYTKRVACSNCGKRGHRLNECPKPKNFGKTKAGAAAVVKLGSYDSGSDDDNEEVHVVYE